MSARMAHAVCPYCYPTDPAVGEPITYWCGTKQTVNGPAPDEMQRCTKCLLSKSCATCGAQMTFLGVMPPEDAA